MRHPLAICENCAAYEIDTTSCHRNPPVAMAVPAGVVAGVRRDMQCVSAFPPVQVKHWCMQFVPNAEVIAQMQALQQTNTDQPQ